MYVEISAWASVAWQSRLLWYALSSPQVEAMLPLIPLSDVSRRQQEWCGEVMSMSWLEANMDGY